MLCELSDSDSTRWEMSQLLFETLKNTKQKLEVEINFKKTEYLPTMTKQNENLSTNENV